MTAHGMIAWSELMTTEVEKAKDFYAQTLGVRFEPFNVGGDSYHVAMVGDQPAWGLMDMTGRPDEGPNGWFTYLAVDDVDARVAGAVAAGAELCVPVFDVPTVGRIAILRDPTGALIGWMTPEADTAG